MDLVKESDKRAIGFFAQLFVDFCLDDMDRKDLLIAVPPGDSTVDSARSPMARVVREVVKLGFGVDGSECVVRTHWVRQKKWPRNREEQRETIRLEGPPPDQVDRVVVVDDILTTGSTMGAVLDILSDVYPSLPKVCVAFGKSKRSPWPPFPQFPDFRATAGDAPFNCGPAG